MKEVKMKKLDRFNGVTEQELHARSLPDRVDYNLDIVFVNINPGLYSVYKGHHYSGPGNHFCMHFLILNFINTFKKLMIFSI